MPLSQREYYLRWLFAFMSVRARWQNNVQAYQRLEQLPEEFTRDDLSEAIHAASVGLWRNRVEGVWRFHNEFRARPARWFPKLGEPLKSCRNRLTGLTYGISYAKVSFALEMAYPFNNEVVCLDTHILRLYGLGGEKKTPTPRLYLQMEEHWCTTCASLGVPPVIARHIIWDRTQQETLTRYWSFVFERTNHHVGQGESQARGGGSYLDLLSPGCGNMPRQQRDLPKILLREHGLLRVS